MEDGNKNNMKFDSDELTFTLSKDRNKFNKETVLKYYIGIKY